MKNSTHSYKGHSEGTFSDKHWFVFTLVYAMIALADILILSSGQWLHLREISKPLILISLMGYFAWRSFPLKAKTERLFFLGLFFSFLGDGFLNYEGYFLQGLFSFFTAHVFYCMAFLKRQEVKSLVKRIPVYAVLLYAGSIYLLLDTHLGALKPYVILYMVILIALVLCLLTRKGHVDKMAYYTGLVGGILFLISDSLLAINKFAFPTWMGSQMVMITYALAQYFLTWSFLQARK